MSKTSIKLPLAPLTAFIERKGGLTGGFPGFGFIIIDVDDDGRETVAADRSAEEQSRYDRAHKRLDNWRTRGGVVPIFSADEFAVDMLGIHPSEVWGDWFELESADTEVQQAEVALALVDVADHGLDEPLADWELELLGRVA